ncbi:MAG: linear amide C-N hydrolase, partial [Candidatus Aenigmarchaeota archaeon]|nr:linear amide C-N hydrolase [Candidatus Aenigmarchaeota archaeon]
FEIGQQQGEIYKKNGMNFRNIRIDQNLFENQLKIYKEHYPQLLEQFKGIAKAGNWDKDKVIYSFITGEIFTFTQVMKIRRACTIFGLQNENGTFIGRNYDWVQETENFFKIYKVQNPKRDNFIAVTDMALELNSVNKEWLFYNADDAINEKGLFIGLTFAYNEKWSHGLSCIHMIKLITETCGTVKEALDVFKKVPLCCPKNFFIADKNGDMAVVEHTSKKFKILRSKDGLLIQTNHYVDQELMEEDSVLKNNPTHTTFLRYYETLREVNKKKSEFQLSDVIKIMGDKDSFVLQEIPPIRTIWTLALDMKKQNYILYWDLLGKRKQMKLKI